MPGAQSPTSALAHGPGGPVLGGRSMHSQTRNRRTGSLAISSGHREATQLPFRIVDRCSSRSAAGRSKLAGAPGCLCRPPQNPGMSGALVVGIERARHRAHRPATHKASVRAPSWDIPAACARRPSPIKPAQELNQCPGCRHTVSPGAQGDAPSVDREHVIANSRLASAALRAQRPCQAARTAAGAALRIEPLSRRAWCMKKARSSRCGVWPPTFCVASVT